MKKLFVMLFASFVMAVAMTQTAASQATDHWSTLAECQAAPAGTPTYVPAKDSSIPMSKEEIVFVQPSQACTQMDLPKDKGGVGFVRTPAGAEFVYNTVTRVTRYKLCRNKSYLSVPIPTSEPTAPSTLNRASAAPAATTPTIPAINPNQVAQVQIQQVAMNACPTVNLNQLITDLEKKSKKKDFKVSCTAGEVSVVWNEHKPQSLVMHPGYGYGGGNGGGVSYYGQGPGLYNNGYGTPAPAVDAVYTYNWGTTSVVGGGH